MGMGLRMGLGMCMGMCIVLGAIRLMTRGHWSPLLTPTPTLTPLGARPKLQPYAHRAATVRTPGCNRTHRRHMMFTGNPGVGKTTVSRLVAKLYKELGVSSNERVVEV